ncbi:MAG TPA: O-antigen ligase family protein [Candidatus Sulfotelmatobacter sp.]|nr:O-antigen ligase family protein [Candidatus Sulfotelmatobacter sp.]
MLLLLLFTAVCLPTGSIFGLNVKAALFVVFVVALAWFLVTHSSDWPTLSEQIFLGIFISCACFWAIIAIYHGESDTKQIFLELKDIATTVLIAWFCYFFLRRKLLQPESVITSVICAAVTVGFIKLALILCVLILRVEPVSLIESVFGEASLVSGEIGLGLTRLGFSSDIVGGFALFAVLCPSVSGVRLRRSFVALCVFMLLVSGLLSYARYVWITDLFAIVAALVIERRVKVLLLSALVVGIVAGTSFEALNPLFAARFSSEQTSESDLIRIEQSKALWDEIEARPVFGKGIGQHALGLIRNEQNPYSYELQWMSLLMQLGLVGVGAILVLFVAAARDLLAVRGPAKFWLAALYLLWLLGSWTNPYLISSFAGATFGMFLAMFYRMRMIAEENVSDGQAAIVS